MSIGNFNDVSLSYCASTQESNPLYVGINETSSHGSLVIDTSNDQINTLNSRPSDINQPTLPEIYTKLTSPKAKQEFETFWKLVQSIVSNPNAHKYDNYKRLITNQPLKLSNFFTRFPSGLDWNLVTFLKEQGITLGAALLDNAHLDNAKLNRANLHRASLHSANLNSAKLKEASLWGANLNSAKLCGARLNGADLCAASLYGADLYGAHLNGATVGKDTKFSTDTILDEIKCDSIGFENERREVAIITDQEKIRQKFIELGAKDENISFAQAA